MMKLEHADRSAGEMKVELMSRPHVTRLRFSYVLLEGSGFAYCDTALFLPSPGRTPPGRVIAYDFFGRFYLVFGSRGCAICGSPAPPGQANKSAGSSYTTALPLQGRIRNTRSMRRQAMRHQPAWPA
jgi:hypothetical protein